MDTGQIALVQGLLRQESRSLLRYASESYPWANAAGQAACAAVMAMAKAEENAVTKLARWLAKQRVPLTFPGAYPMQFTTTNFVSLDYLVPLLVEEQNKLVVQAEKAHAAFSDPDGRALVHELLELNKSHLHQLEALRAKIPPPAAAS